MRHVSPDKFVYLKDYSSYQYHDEDSIMMMFHTPLQLDSCEPPEFIPVTLYWEKGAVEDDDSDYINCAFQVSFLDHMRGYIRRYGFKKFIGSFIYNGGWKKHRMFLYDFHCGIPRDYFRRILAKENHYILMENQRNGSGARIAHFVNRDGQGEIIMHNIIDGNIHGVFYLEKERIERIVNFSYDIVPFDKVYSKEEYQFDPYPMNDEDD